MPPLLVQLSFQVNPINFNSRMITGTCIGYTGTCYRYNVNYCIIFLYVNNGKENEDDLYCSSTRD